jgi:hypothetical protein
MKTEPVRAVADERPRVGQDKKEPDAGAPGSEGADGSGEPSTLGRCRDVSTSDWMRSQYEPNL